MHTESNQFSHPRAGDQRASKLFFQPSTPRSGRVQNARPQKVAGDLGEEPSTWKAVVASKPEPPGAPARVY